MRAWYGRGRYWFVVAAAQGASTAWGWCGYEARWEKLGREFEHWSESDFADAIAFSAVPGELIEALAETLDRLSSTVTGERFGVEPPVPGVLH
jgi:hypothetical protein